MSSNKPPVIIVVGAGINGLACAVNIQECCPEARVEIVADKMSPHTTSEISAGFWMPYVIGDTEPGLILKLSKVTHEHLVSLAHSALAGDLAVQQLSGYFLSADDAQPSGDNIIKCVVDGYRSLTPEELARFPMAKSGNFHTTVQVDVTMYMKWLTRRFTESGGVMHSRKLSSLGELIGQCDLVVNCCGLGGRDLLKDDQVVPIRGQVWRVHAPWIKHFYVFMPGPGMDSTYILPGVGNIVVGGTHQVGDWRTDVDEQDSVNIWKRAQGLLPQMAKATPIKAWAGLRPARTTLRLEPELMDVGGEELKVVHNYGHGGSGITLHWGCALEVTKLVLESLGYQSSRLKQLVVKAHM